MREVRRVTGGWSTRSDRGPGLLGHCEPVQRSQTSVGRCRAVVRSAYVHGLRALRGAARRRLLPASSLAVVGAHTPASSTTALPDPHQTADKQLLGRWTYGLDDKLLVRHHRPVEERRGGQALHFDQRPGRRVVACNATMAVVDNENPLRRPYAHSENSLSSRRHGSRHRCWMRHCDPVGAPTLPERYLYSTLLSEPEAPCSSNRRIRPADLQGPALGRGSSPDCKKYSEALTSDGNKVFCTHRNRKAQDHPRRARQTGAERSLIRARQPGSTRWATLGSGSARGLLLACADDP